VRLVRVAVALICWCGVVPHRAGAQLGMGAAWPFPLPGRFLPPPLLPPPLSSQWPRVNAVVNGASFGANGEAAPGSFVTIYGSNFGSKDKLGDLFPATEFDGLSVRFSGAPLPGEIRAPLFHVIASRNQINLLTPGELPESGKVTVTVRQSGVAGAVSSDLRMVPAAPGIFRVSGTKNAIAQFASRKWLVIPQALARQLGVPDDCAGLSALADCGQPASPGDDIQIFVTGLGRATPGGAPGADPLRTGFVAPADGQPLYWTVQKPMVTIGEVPAEVQFAGLVPGFAGLYQVNVRVPKGAPRGDEVPLTIAMPDGPPDTATIAIRW
jgi:minor extracellular serine protease Vpr